MNVEIPMEILSDEKGYLDRQCPNENCLFEFKVNMQDWEDKVSDDEVHCPLCGQIASSDSWYTYEQLDAMQEIAADWARNYMLGEIDKMFGNLARSTRNNKYIKITYKKNRPVTFVNNPIGAILSRSRSLCRYGHKVNNHKTVLLKAMTIQKYSKILTVID